MPNDTIVTTLALTLSEPLSAGRRAPGVRRDPQRAGLMQPWGTLYLWTERAHGFHSWLPWYWVRAFGVGYEK